MTETAVCRGCRKVLRGKSYHMGWPAYDPRTGERCKVNFYGGFVCSEACDRRVSLELEQTMPGHGYTQTRLSPYAAESLKQNWSHGR